MQYYFSTVVTSEKVDLLLPESADRVENGGQSVHGRMKEVHETKGHRGPRSIQVGLPN